jgi:hypothetical protein
LFIGDRTRKLGKNALSFYVKTRLAFPLRNPNVDPLRESKPYRVPFWTTIHHPYNMGPVANGTAGQHYDLVVVGSGFAGSVTTLNFLEECKRSNKTGKVDVGKEDEQCGASRWAMAYLCLDKNNNFDPDWIKEMYQVSNGLADLEYCKKMGVEVPIAAQYLLDHGVKLNHHRKSWDSLLSPVKWPK